VSPVGWACHARTSNLSRSRSGACPTVRSRTCIIKPAFRTLWINDAPLPGAHGGTRDSTGEHRGIAAHTFGVTADAIPVQVGYQTPDWYDEMEAWQRMSALSRPESSPTPIERSAPSKPEFWIALGVRPVWSGEDTSVCVAAVDPGLDGGASDLERLIAGARRRDENVVIVSGISSQRPGHRGGPSGRLPLRINGGEVTARSLPTGVAASAR
jgi:hypothetical protein